MGIAGERNGADMKPVRTVVLEPHERLRSKYKENMFESRMIGLGIAMEVENERRIKEQKKKQVKI